MNNTELNVQDILQNLQNLSRQYQLIYWILNVYSEKRGLVKIDSTLSEFKYLHPNNTNVSFLVKWMPLGNDYIAMNALCRDDIHNSSSVISWSCKWTLFIDPSTTFPFPDSEIEHELTKILESMNSTIDLFETQVIQTFLKFPSHDISYTESSIPLYGKLPQIGTEIRSSHSDNVNIGKSDLDILAPITPGSGMIIGPNHPIFHHPRPFPSQDDRSIAPGSLPPGARFDPIDPFEGNETVPGTEYGLPGSMRIQRPRFSNTGEDNRGRDEILPPTGLDPEFNKGTSSCFPNLPRGTGGIRRPPF